MSSCPDLMEGYKAIELNSEDQSKEGRSLWAQCQAVADMKFTYVVSCQLYGIQKRSGDARAQDILRLMTTYVTKNFLPDFLMNNSKILVLLLMVELYFRYPSLRVAYIDEVEEPSKDRAQKINQKAYYSTLVKAALPKSIDSSEPVQNLDQVMCYTNYYFHIGCINCDM
jgi:callose synthase